MARWRWLPLILLLAACRRPEPLPDLLVETVAGVWHRTALERPPVSDAADPVPRSAVMQFETATYEGPGKLQARVYALDSPAVALDLVQRWRPSADTVFFYHGRYFVVLKWQDADRAALKAFAAELEKRLEKTKE